MTYHLRSQRLLELAIDGATVYWTGSLLFGSDPAGSGSVSKAPVDGSQAPTVLASDLDLPFAISVDSQFVYWTESRGVMRLAK